MSDVNINISLKVNRQMGNEQNVFENYNLEDIPQEASFLEMLDILNDKLISEQKDPVAFDSDCREGICGACSLVIDGVPHGKEFGITACQLHMRKFNNNDVITIEPWRATAFPVIKDLTVDRSALDRIMQAGGYVSVKTGTTIDANSILISKKLADEAFDAAACIGCGACVAACKNSSPMLFVGAKIKHLSNLPQGHPERKTRVKNMIMQMSVEGFGGCTNTLECEAVCPKEISTSVISCLNREFILSRF
jgi:succinate dehydrogenase / fumarate reductase iron-sulfur subunit